MDSVIALAQSDVDLMQGYLFGKPAIESLPSIDAAIAKRIMQVLSKGPSERHTGMAAILS